jgi:hypothetical protein
VFGKESFSKSRSRVFFGMVDLKKFQRAEEIKKEMLELEAELSTLFASNSKKTKSDLGETAAIASGKKKRGRKKGSKMSAAARAKIADAQRKRWAVKKKADAKSQSTAPVKRGKGSRKRGIVSLY